MQTSNLSEQIQTAQLLFVTSTSRLLQEAETVRRQRDELLKLIGEIGSQSSSAQKGATDEVC